jgi:anti-sigma B factor antagonist
VPTPEPFSATVGRVSPVVVVTCTGEVDASTVTDLNTVLDQAVTAHDRHVVVDCGGVTFIDSTGISALVAGGRRLNRTRRRMALSCTSDSALGRALAISGLDRMFEVHATQDAAVRALADAPMLGR